MAVRPFDLQEGRRRGRLIIKLLAPWNLIEAGSLKNDLHPLKIERNIQEFIQKHVPCKHPDNEKCRQLLLDYRDTKSLEPLLRLYTLETLFYKKLHENPHLLGHPISCELSSLKKRFYQGISYRGLVMTYEDFEAYGWAFENKDS